MLLFNKGTRVKRFWSNQNFENVKLNIQIFSDWCTLCNEYRITGISFSRYNI